MCYRVVLSTDSPDDLRRRGGDGLGFEPLATDERALSAWLEFPVRWEVRSPSGCGCTLRHLEGSALELGFAAPVAWMPEDDAAIAATGALYDVLLGLTRGGHLADLCDFWGEAPPERLAELALDLEDIPREHFRLFAGHRFTLRSRRGLALPEGGPRGGGGADLGGDGLRGRRCAGMEER